MVFNKNGANGKVKAWSMTFLFMKHRLYSVLKTMRRKCRYTNISYSLSLSQCADWTLLQVRAHTHTSCVPSLIFALFTVRPVSYHTHTTTAYLLWCSEGYNIHHCKSGCKWSFSAVPFFAAWTQLKRHYMSAIFAV